MDHRKLKERLRAQAIEEARLDDETEAQAEGTLRRWKRATALVGGTLFVGVVSVVPFLAGQPFHSRWEAIGKKVLLLAMALYGVFIYTAAHTLIFWKYLRDLRMIHKKYAPPTSKYRTGRNA